MDNDQMPKTLADFVAEARSRVREIHPDDLDEMIGDHDDLLIVDVREADEFAKGHIPGALLIPRGLIEGAADVTCKHRVAQLSDARGKTVVLYCQTGGRSAMATDVLQQMGFKHAYNLAGGIELWAAEGFAVVQGL